MGCVYQAKNKINGKCYIGKTIYNLRDRINGHKCNFESSLLSKDLAKYGMENFKWSILFESDDNLQLLQMENEFIFLRNTLSPNGYNKNHSGTDSIRLKSKRLVKKIKRNRNL